VLKLPVMPATDPMLTIEPPPESLMSGAQVWMPLRVLVTLSEVQGPDDARQHRTRTRRSGLGYVSMRCLQSRANDSCRA
jgi:hypothetical protein